MAVPLPGRSPGRSPVSGANDEFLPTVPPLTALSVIQLLGIFFRLRDPFIKKNGFSRSLIS